MRFFMLLLLKDHCKWLKFVSDSLKLRNYEMFVSYYECGASIMSTSDFGGSLFFNNK